MTAQLYCFGESGHSYKVALTLTLAELPWEPVYVDFFNGESRSDAFRALNPMGECPVYVDGDLPLTQSGVILTELVKRTGKFGGATEAEQREVLRWVLWDNHKMSAQVGMTRFLMNFVPEDKRPQEVIAFMQGRLKSAYATLNSALADRDWIFPVVLTCFTPNPLGLCGPIGPILTLGWGGSKPFPAGNTLMI